MATVVWVGNSQATAGVVTLRVTAVAVGGTLTATINGKNIAYTCVTGDTVSTAAAGWQALLSDSGTVPAEFSEITWTVSTDTVTATASIPGVPFVGMTGGLTSAGAGGATVTQTTTVASLSPSDVGLAANWLRAGVAAIPVNGDDVIVADTDVPLLWNLTALVAVQFATYRRWQSFEGSIGLPSDNPLGYLEYRPTYFKFVGSGTLPFTLGEGQVGGGPSLERYDVGAQRTNFNILASGSAAGTYSINLLGTNANNTLKLVNTSAGVATGPTEVSTLASATVDGGATLALGSGVTFSGTLLATGSTLVLTCAPATLTLKGGCTVTIGSQALTYAAITADEGTTIAYPSNSTITALTLARGSRLDKSNDVQAMTITNATVDGDCQIIDPNNCITYSNAVTVNGQVTGGVFTFTGTRTVLIT